MSVPEAAEMLGISQRTAWDRVKDGSLPSKKLGGRVLVPVVELHKLLAVS